MRDLDLKFLKAMRVKLDYGRRCGRVGWDRHWENTTFHTSNLTGPTSLFVQKLLGEVTELIVALEKGDLEQILFESADVANFAMFIADIHGCLDCRNITKKSSGQETPVIVNHPPVCTKCMKCHWPDVSCR